MTRDEIKWELSGLTRENQQPTGIDGLRLSLQKLAPDWILDQAGKDRKDLDRKKDSRNISGTVTILDTDCIKPQLTQWVRRDSKASGDSRPSREADQPSSRFSCPRHYSTCGRKSLGHSDRGVKRFIIFAKVVFGGDKSGNFWYGLAISSKANNQELMTPPPTKP